MTLAELLTRCAAAADVDETEFSDLESLSGFFQRLRPNGEGLDLILTGTPIVEDVKSRLRAVFEVTKTSWDENDAYFQVRSPRPISLNNAARLAEAHLRRCVDIAMQLRKEWLISLLTPFPVIHPQRVMESNHTATELDEAIYDAVSEFIESLTSDDSGILMLRDAIYYMTCDPMVTEYILWPCYRRSSRIIEPFEPCFSLWMYGCRVEMDAPHTVAVLIPDVAGAAPQ